MNKMLQSGIAENNIADPTIKQMIVAQRGTMIIVFVEKAKSKNAAAQIVPPPKDRR